MDAATSSSRNLETAFSSCLASSPYWVGETEMPLLVELSTPVEWPMALEKRTVAWQYVIRSLQADSLSLQYGWLQGGSPSMRPTSTGMHLSEVLAAGRTYHSINVQMILTITSLPRTLCSGECGGTRLFCLLSGLGCFCQVNHAPQGCPAKPDDC